MHSLLRQNKKTLALALPIMVGHVSQMLLGLADTVMIGRIGTTELAAAAFANVIFNTFFVVAIGLFIAVSVNTAHEHGAKRDQEAAEILRNSLSIALFIGILLALVLCALNPLLYIFKQPQSVTILAPKYLFWLAISLIPAVPALTIKSFCEAKNQPWAVFLVMLGGVALNVALNYVLIFGNLGFPRLELVGAGVATFISRMTVLFVILYYLTKSKRLASSLPKKWIRRLNNEKIASLFKVGSPTAGQLTIAFGSFSITALLMGQFGNTALAAHQIAITCTALIFMFPLGIGMAVSIRVGHSIGGKEAKICHPIIWGAQIISFLITGFFAISLIAISPTFAGVFSTDPNLVELSASLLKIVALFLIFDGAQAISMSALRGLRDVIVPTVLIFFSYWVFAIPFAAIIAFKLDFGSRGLWVGLAVGLALGALLLTTRLIQQLRKLVGLVSESTQK
ncbi:MAG: MATE family efflux transporter [Verrucomicrobiota bacterium]|nr:MATE family efflux transporter [Verrucomicrobiota bacterium]